MFLPSAALVGAALLFRAVTRSFGSHCDGLPPVSSHAARFDVSFLFKVAALSFPASL